MRNNKSKFTVDTKVTRSQSLHPNQSPIHFTTTALQNHNNKYPKFRININIDITLQHGTQPTNPYPFNSKPQ